MAILVFAGNYNAYFWVLCTEKYFKVKNIPEHEKMVLAATAMSGCALKWWRCWSPRHPETSWDIFTTSLLWRFNPDYRVILPIFNEEEEPDQESPQVMELDDNFQEPSNDDLLAWDEFLLASEQMEVPTMHAKTLVVATPTPLPTSDFDGGIVNLIDATAEKPINTPDCKIDVNYHAIFDFAIKSEAIAEIQRNSHVRSSLLPKQVIYFEVTQSSSYFASQPHKPSDLLYCTVESPPPPPAPPDWSCCFVTYEPWRQNWVHRLLTTRDNTKSDEYFGFHLNFRPKQTGLNQPNPTIDLLIKSQCCHRLSFLKLALLRFLKGTAAMLAPKVYDRWFGDGKNTSEHFNEEYCVMTHGGTLCPCISFLTQKQLNWKMHMKSRSARLATINLTSQVQTHHAMVLFPPLDISWLILVIIQLSSPIILHDVVLILHNTYSFHYFCNAGMKFGLVLLNLGVTHDFGLIFWIESLYGVLNLEPLIHLISKRTCTTSCHALIPLATSVHANLELLEATPKLAKITKASVISACSQLRNGSYGRWIESNMKIDCGITLGDLLATTLLDLYEKCGSFCKANELSGGLQKRDLEARFFLLYLVEHFAFEFYFALWIKATIACVNEMVEKGGDPNTVTCFFFMSPYDMSHISWYHIIFAQMLVIRFSSKLLLVIQPQMLVSTLCMGSCNQADLAARIAKDCVSYGMWVCKLSQLYEDIFQKVGSVVEICALFDGADAVHLVKGVLLVTCITQDNILVNLRMHIKAWDNVQYGSGVATSSVVAATVVKGLLNIIHGDDYFLINKGFSQFKQCEDGSLKLEAIWIITPITQHHHLGFNLEDKVDFNGEGNVMILVDEREIVTQLSKKLNEASQLSKVVITARHIHKCGGYKPKLVNERGVEYLA